MTWLIVMYEGVRYNCPTLTGMVIEAKLGLNKKGYDLKKVTFTGRTFET